MEHSGQMPDTFPVRSYWHLGQYPGGTRFDKRHTISDGINMRISGTHSGTDTRKYPPVVTLGRSNMPGISPHSNQRHPYGPGSIPRFRSRIHPKNTCPFPTAKKLVLPVYPIHLSMLERNTERMPTDMSMPPIAVRRIHARSNIIACSGWVGCERLGARATPWIKVGSHSRHPRGSSTWILTRKSC